MSHPHVMILSDDIYEDLTFGESKHTNIVEVEPCLRDRNSVGWRVFKVVCNDWLAGGLWSWPQDFD